MHTHTHTRHALAYTQTIHIYYINKKFSVVHNKFHECKQVGVHLHMHGNSYSLSVTVVDHCMVSSTATPTSSLELKLASKKLLLLINYYAFVAGQLLA